MNVRLTPEAEEDLAEAQRWYRQRGLEIPRRFRLAVEVGLDLIASHPEAQPIAYRNVRRILLHRFPYSLFYLIEEDTAVVFCCFHSSRDPRVWQDRADAALD